MPQNCCFYSRIIELEYAIENILECFDMAASPPSTLTSTEDEVKVNVDLEQALLQAQDLLNDYDVMGVEEDEI